MQLNRWGNKFLIIWILLPIVGCNSGSSASSSPAPSPIPAANPLESAIELLNYSGTLPGDGQPQVTFGIGHEIMINQLEVSYFSDNSCKRLSMSYPIDGFAVLAYGTYQTTSGFNWLLCSNYKAVSGSGCVYAYSDNHSLQFKITGSDGIDYLSPCLTNPEYNGERFGNYNLVNHISTNCSLYLPCGFSQNYTFKLN